MGYLSSVRESKININNIENVDWLLNLNPVSFNKRKKDEELQKDKMEELTVCTVERKDKRKKDKRKKNKRSAIKSLFG